MGWRYKIFFDISPVLDGNFHLPGQYFRHFNERFQVRTDHLNVRAALVEVAFPILVHHVWCTVVTATPGRGRQKQRFGQPDASGRHIWRLFVRCSSGLREGVCLHVSVAAVVPTTSSPPRISNKAILLHRHRLVCVCVASPHRTHRRPRDGRRHTAIQASSLGAKQEDTMRRCDGVTMRRCDDAGPWRWPAGVPGPRWRSKCRWVKVLKGNGRGWAWVGSSEARYCRLIIRVA